MHRNPNDQQEFPQETIAFKASFCFDRTRIHATQHACYQEFSGISPVGEVRRRDPKSFRERLKKRRLRERLTMPGNDHPTRRRKEEEEMTTALQTTMSKTLSPLPLVWLRWTVFWAAAIPMLYWTEDGYLVEVACFWIAFTLGTFPVVRIQEERLERQWHVLFVPLPSRKIPLASCTGIETDWEERGGLIEAMMLGLYGLVLCRVRDWGLAWLGGHCKIWVRMSDGQKILIWQGSSVRNLKYNSAALSAGTGLGIRSISR